MSITSLHNPRNKLIGLCIAAFLLSWAAYNFSFARTLEVRRQVLKDALRISQLRDAPRQIEQFEKLLAGFNPNQEYSIYNREQFFEEVNIFCRENDLQILYFHPEQRRNVQNFQLITNQLEIQGDFKNIVQLVWHIEHEKRLGHIASASYKTMEDKRTGKIWLTGSFFIQNYFQNAAN